MDDKACSTPDCDKPARARGMCTTCYKRFLRANRPCDREPSPTYRVMVHAPPDEPPLPDRDWYTMLQEHPDGFEDLLRTMAVMILRASRE